jgi:hypothetical protein
MIDAVLHHAHARDRPSQSTDISLATEEIEPAEREMDEMTTSMTPELLPPGNVTSDVERPHQSQPTSIDMYLDRMLPNLRFRSIPCETL